MKKIFKSLLRVTLFFIIVSAVIASIYFLVFKDYYNSGIKYMRDLADINETYKSETKDSRLESDILSFGFKKTGNGRFERAYNVSSCEILIVDGDEYTYMVTDVCYSVMNEKVIQDLDNDEKKILYYRTSESTKVLFSESSDESIGVIEFDYEKSTYEFSGKKLPEVRMERYNRSYQMLIDEFNARIF